MLAYVPAFPNIRGTYDQPFSDNLMPSILFNLISISALIIFGGWIWLCPQLGAVSTTGLGFGSGLGTKSHQAPNTDFHNLYPYNSTGREFSIVFFSSFRTSFRGHNVKRNPSFVTPQDICQQTSLTEIC